MYVDRPVAEVFDFLADVSNETKWRQSIVGSRYVGADLPAAGIDGETDVAMGSRSLTMRWTIADFIDGEYVSWRLDGDPWSGGGSYRVRACGGGSDVQASLEVRLKGPLRVAEPIVGLQFRRGLRSDLNRLVGYFAGSATA